MSYRLYYFPLRGRGEQIRLMLHALMQPFEDVAVKRDQFVEMKKEGPRQLAFGSLPMLEDGELRLVQGPVILGYLARKHGAAPTDLKQAARADAIALGAEDLRTKYFGTLSGDNADEKKAAFRDGDWRTRWLPSLEGLLELNAGTGGTGDTGFFVGDSLTHADIAVWDALDGVLTNIAGATLDGFPRLVRFRESIAKRPAIAEYLLQRK
ncbi:MAG: glutathione S-transferase family protein [Polyangia bacterium]